jgi:ABC-type multidrug transport system fused ATPase/permease subunit
MARSILVTETFIRATQAGVGSGDDSAALTLMSTDVERINLGFIPLHELWASIIQAALAGWLLFNHLGFVFFVPIGMVLLCATGLAILMRFTGDSQRAWMAGVQKRVGLTASVIANMKSLKLSGLSAAVSDLVQNLRVEELAAGINFRKLNIIAALFGYIPFLITPPLTFAFTQRTLDASTMFTSLSYLTLLTIPLTEIFQSIPGLLSAVACLGRIQAFLERESRHDFRNIRSDLDRNSEKAQAANDARLDSRPDAAHPIVIRNGQFGWEANTFALQNVNTQVTRSSLTMVVGPVGSGKSTFCKALLGEIPFREGSVVLSSRFLHVGYCDQTAFLMNGTIRDNIVRFSPFDPERYAEVIEATALRFDLDNLPQGDRTNIGSDGITLSGGQRQRVSLARALYLQTDLLVLDDVFSGLDADTEEQVFRQVFGPDGLLKRRHSTVVLCTHSIRHLPVADHIIALGDGTVVEQGSFSELMTSQGYVHRLRSWDASGSETSSEKTMPKDGGRESKQPLLQETATNTSSHGTHTNVARQVGDRTVYKHYFKSMGLLLAGCSLFFATLWGFFTNFPTVCKSFSSGNLLCQL